MPAVRSFEDAASVLVESSDRLASDPVRCNLVLSLLHGRVQHPEPGRYWVVDGVDGVEGVVFQSPLSMHATATPLPVEVVDDVVAVVARDAPDLPGITGDALTAATFAGQWTERTGSASRPEMGQRLYELADLAPPRRTTRGFPRPVTADEVDAAAEWLVEFGAEADVPDSFDNARVVAARWAATDDLWFWDDGGPVALAGRRAPVAAAVRIGPVYTPRERRGRGYGTSLTYALSKQARDDGHRCLLYTDLSNPTSNSIYRALGYRAVAEVLRYGFASR